MNPMEILKTFVNGGGNPQQVLMKAMGMNGNNNVMISNLMNMANKGDAKGVEQFARNYLKERGMDFDKEFSAFMSNFNKR